MISAFSVAVRAAPLAKPITIEWRGRDRLSDLSADLMEPTGEVDYCIAEFGRGAAQ